MRVNRQSKQRLLEGLGIALLAISLRIYYTAPYPTGWDDVDFALALTQYDMSRMQPHFPGYPVYIVAARLLLPWLQDPFLALSVLSGLAGGLTIMPLWLLFNRLGSIQAARLAVWLYTVAPLPLISSVQPMSDALGACIAAWVAYFCWRAVEGGGKQETAGTFPLLAAGITLGLLLGVRVSYISLSILWIWAVVSYLRKAQVSRGIRYRDAFASAAAAGSVCLAWLMALVISEGGFDKFVSLAVSFTGGHFSDWGGTYQADSSLLARFQLMLGRQIGAAGFGTVWQDSGGVRWIPSVFLLAAGIGCLLSLYRWMKKFNICSNDSDYHHQRTLKIMLFLVVWILPYLVWVLFAQNVEKPRHILPLLPPILYLASAGLRQLTARMGRVAVRERRIGLSGPLFYLAGGMWILGTFEVSLPLIKEAKAVESPMMQLGRYVGREVPADGSLIFAWEEQRVVKLLNPAHQAIRLRHWEDFQTEVLQYETAQKVYATNSLIEGFQRPVDGLFQEVAEFRGNPWLYPTYHTIKLYKGTSRLYQELR